MDEFDNLYKAERGIEPYATAYGFNTSNKPSWEDDEDCHQGCKTGKSKVETICFFFVFIVFCSWALLSNQGVQDTLSLWFGK